MKLRVSEGMPPGEYVEETAKIRVVDGVFYNIHAKLSRDVAVAIISAYGSIAGNRRLLVCEPLAATGVRIIRIFREAGVVEKGCANDFSKTAYNNMKINIAINGLEGAIVLSNEDANMHLLKHAWSAKPDVIDIDPFGSPAPYIDSAIQAIKNGGLLAVTGTDLAPLCAVHGKSALRRYHAKPIKVSYCKEVGIRILVGFIAKVAATHDSGITPVLSYSTRHYIRAYVVIHKRVGWANQSIENIGFIEHCPRCLRRWVVRGLTPVFKGVCVCGSATIQAGPIWIGSIMDRTYVEKALEIAERLGLKDAQRILSILLEESFNVVGYYQLDKLASRYGYSSPSIKSVVGLLRKWGYRTSRTHLDFKGVRTNAPYEKVLEAIRIVQKTGLNLHFEV